MNHPHPKGPTPEPAHVSAADTPAPAGRHEAHHPAGSKAKAVKKTRVEEKRIVTAPGPVTFADKLKAYYKGAIMILGAVLIILDQVTPVFDSIFHGTAHNIFASIVAGVTTFLGILKANEKWVDGTPSG